MNFRSGWCNSDLVDHSRCREGYWNKAGEWIACICECHQEEFFAVFWTGADGIPQMEPGWADGPAARKFAKCLQTYRIASTDVQPEVRSYRGQCPW